MSTTPLSRMHRRPRPRRTSFFEQLRRLDDDPILWCGCTARAGASECHDERRSPDVAALHEAAA